MATPFYFLLDSPSQSPSIDLSLSLDLALLQVNDAKLCEDTAAAASASTSAAASAANSAAAARISLTKNRVGGYRVAR